MYWFNVATAISTPVIRYPLPRRVFHSLINECVTRNVATMCVCVYAKCKGGNGMCCLCCTHFPSTSSPSPPSFSALEARFLRFTAIALNLCFNISFQCVLIPNIISVLRFGYRGWFAANKQTSQQKGPSYFKWFSFVNACMRSHVAVNHMRLAQWGIAIYTDVIPLCENIFRAKQTHTCVCHLMYCCSLVLA